MNKGHKVVPLKCEFKEIVDIAMICIRNDIFNRSTRIRRVYEELLKQEKTSVLTLKCLSGGVAFMFVGLFLLAFLSLKVVRNIAKGFCYESGNCIVENSVITGHNVSCKCGMHSCFSHYPYLRVMVSRDNRQDKEKTAVQVCSFA